MACTTRWRGLNVVRATKCAIQTSGSNASSHNAEGAVQFTIGYTVIRRCHVHHSASASMNATSAHRTHHGRSSPPSPTEDVVRALVCAMFDRWGSDAFTAITLRAPPPSAVYNPGTLSIAY